ncbi:hypothetical protein K466DRAFT_563225 [Polyporus arcularius HHB13444]|uniref:Nuclear receptor-binding factor 2 MIT domain-containing protein n=1 Tax=Polyporus arcularius HHB13444 TaxID=1314778 RepID=A0A5C3PSX6_9APHY|nr:hypothetical protein K466DRAFT_563225 [Polyporus arcularius HHB13444]
MAPMDSPLNAAHQHAANADDYLAQGLLIPAAEEHYKAAEAFQACVEASNDDNTKRTLRMLHNEHMKMGKDLQRRIAKLREENKDPALPQKPQRSSKSGPSTSNPVYPPPSASSPPPLPQNRLSESQQTVEESFMLLGQRSDPGDAFHQFWKATEGMLEYLSRPVAFATAPLASEDPTSKTRTREASSNSDTDTDDPFSKKISRGINLVKAAHSRMLTKYDSPTTGSDSDAPGPSTFPPPPQPVHAVDLRDDWDDDIRAFEAVEELTTAPDDDMADSFCLIPSKADPSIASLKEENATLKAELEKQQQQLAKMELALKARQEQDQQLRDSIMLARKEAHRAMISSTVLQRPAPPGQPQVDIASLNINVPMPPAVPAPVAALNAGRDRDPQLVRRVRELEEEVRNLRAENEKQKAMIVRFRERWEKLKESAKRKKEAKASAESTNVVGQRIEEDPEAEAAAERDDARGSKSVEVAA